MGRRFGIREDPERCEQNITLNRQLGRPWRWWKDNVKVKTNRWMVMRPGLKWVTIISAQESWNYGQWNFLQASTKNGRFLDQSRDFSISK